MAFGESIKGWADAMRSGEIPFIGEIPILSEVFKGNIAGMKTEWIFLALVAVVAFFYVTFKLWEKTPWTTVRGT